MKTVILPAVRWRECLPVLRRGGVVAIPTDTVYGVAAMPLDARGIDGIYAAKDRPEEKALPMLVASPADAERIAVLSNEARQLCAAFWPGALTVVAAARPEFRSPALAADGTVGLRMPALDLALQVIGAAGGVLAVTSANLSGRPPALSAAAVLEQLDGRIDLVLDGGPSPGGVASTVVRVTSDGFEILRAGALAPAALNDALRT
jgi:L-threonylcarbamoyladenylate synthase